MSAVHRYDEPPLAEDDYASDEASTLTWRLKVKLDDLKAAGYRVQWIEVSHEALVTLFADGGDQAILMDPDPAIDRAWFGEFEVRPTDKSCIWIYLEGEYDDLSVHIVT
ncbi:hypothetical protein [Phenylobacterium sp.]|uniref:hypothetical protein n=1 Tax=Phenylobacterium sp. TaxID=1871053 RepID=UPI0035654574